MMHVTVVTMTEGTKTTGTGRDVLDSSTSGVHRAAGVTVERDGIGTPALMTVPIAGRMLFLRAVLYRTCCGCLV